MNYTLTELIDQYHNISARRKWGFSRSTAKSVNALEMRNICYDLKMTIRRKLNKHDEKKWVETHNIQA